MKKIYSLLFFAMLLSTSVMGQAIKPKFIQINSTVDALGNIKFMQLEGTEKKQKNSQDTTAEYKGIIKIISKSKNAIEAINLLSGEGWILISAVALVKDDHGRPNSPFIAYYFKRD